MVVAVIAVLMVQPALNQMILMIAVRNLLVAAARVIAAARHGFAGLGIGRIDGQLMLVVMAVVLGMQVAIVQVIDVAVMLNARVAAVLAVDVRMRAVSFVAHDYSWERGNETTDTN